MIYTDSFIKKIQIKKIITLFKARILLIMGILFSINVYAIDDAIKPSGGGLITWEGSLLWRYATAEPSSGYRFVKWEITDRQTGKLKLSSTDNPIHVHRDYVNCHLPSGQDDQCYLITAYFEVISYTITFKNWDGSTITTTNVTQGAMPSYSGSTPTRPSTAEYTYTFSGWTPTIVAATANATYTATYASTPRYTITFNANGGLIPTNGNMDNTPAGQITTLSADRKSGTVVVTKDKTHFQTMANDCPSRVGYTFAGWYTDPTSGVQVYDNTGYRVVGTYWNSEGKWIGTSNVTVYAHWTPIPYTITVNSSNVSQGSASGGGTYDYGTNHQIAATPNECYQFTQWSDGNTDNPRTITVTGNATYTAEFEKIQYTIEAQPANPSQGSATVTNP